MNTLLKTLLLTTAPALAVAAPADINPPSTQPAPVLAQSNAPLIIPDGTSPQNPGPAFLKQNVLYDGIDDIDVDGIRH